MRMCSNKLIENIMDDRQTSKFRFYSLGNVAENKALNSNDVEVYAKEIAPMADGEITSNSDTLKASGTNQDGAAYQVSAPVTNTLKCTWLPFGSSNRMTSPDVRRGEEVMIWQVGDSDKYYWTTTLDGSHLRKLETVIYSFSATKDENAKADATNSYYFEVSTHEKLIHLHTSQTNGEKYGFDIQLNTDQGFLQIQDTTGNIFTFDPSEQQITMKNVAGSLVDINKENININASGNITMKAGGTIVMTSTETSIN